MVVTGLRTSLFALFLAVTLALGTPAKAEETAAGAGDVTTSSAAPASTSAPGATTAPAKPAAGRAPPPDVAASAATQRREPTSEELEQARRHFDAALEFYSQGRYRDAITELLQSQELDPAGKDLVYNLALVHEKLGELEPALGYFRKYLDMETDADERARTEASIARVEGALRHGYGRTNQSQPLSRCAESAPIAAPPGRLDTWVWAAGGVAVAALVVGTVFGVRALVLNPGEGDATNGSRSADDIRHDAERAHRSAVAADVAFAAGATSAALGTILYFGRSPVPERDATSGGLHLMMKPRVGLDIGLVF